MSLVKREAQDVMIERWRLGRWTLPGSNRDTHTSRFTIYASASPMNRNESSASAGTRCTP